MNNFTEEAYCNNVNKLCVVFDQINYPTSRRNGGEKDREQIKECFEEKLEYKFEVYPDLTKKGFSTHVNKVRKICIDENIGCLVVFILGHGNRTCILSVDNEEINIYEHIVRNFAAIDDTFMKGMPKLFIIQSCRGENYLGHCFADSGGIQNNDNTTGSDSDILIAYSSLPGTVSLRDSNHGTPFIYYLSNIFSEFYKLYDVVTMLTMVNQLMAENIMINATAEIRNKKESVDIKLLSCFKSQLTRRMYLSDVPTNFFESLIYKKEPFPFVDVFSSQKLRICGPKVDEVIQEKICLIISQTEFSNFPWKEGWRGKKDTDEDIYVDKEAIRLQELFQTLDFKVLIKTNLSSSQIENIMESINEDGVKMDKVKCLVVILLTNGDGERMRANESVMTIQDLKKPFVNCVKIAQIPKLFLVQACGGGKQGENADEDENGTKYKNLELKVFVTPEKKMPVEANSLIVYSSFSDRGNGQGTKFVEELCNVIEQNHLKRDVVGLLTLVNKKLSEKLQGENPEFFCMPCWFVSRLTGEVFLTGDRWIKYSELPPNVEKLELIKSNQRRRIIKTDNEDSSSEYNNQEHLIIFVCNNDIGNDDSLAQTHSLRLLSDLFRSLNFKCHQITRITNLGYISECQNIIDTYKEKCFKSIWIMFICPAVEYGPVSSDARCFNLTQVLAELQNVAEITNVIIFATPYEASNFIQQDVREVVTSAVSNLKELESNDKFDEMVNLSAGLKKKVLNNLNNYYMLSVPISIAVDDNKLYVNIFTDYIQSSFDKKQTVGWAFKSINEELKKMKWPTKLLPDFEMKKDFVILNLNDSPTISGELADSPTISGQLVYYP